MPDKTPLYLRIAGELRERMASGDLPPGARLPTQAALQRQYAASSTAVIYALKMLEAEGRIDRRRGSGTYVRESTRLVRRAHARDMRAAGPTSPFARDAQAAGTAPRWEHHSEHDQATPRVAERLGIQPGSPVMVTRYRFLADDEPIQLSRSYEPLAVTGGTEVEWPEEGAAIGVVARMDLIGTPPTHYTERVHARPASPEEAEQLGLSPRGGMTVLAIERTYFAGELAVETADIVFPSDRYELEYTVPIDPAP